MLVRVCLGLVDYMFVCLSVCVFGLFVLLFNGLYVCLGLCFFVCFWLSLCLLCVGVHFVVFV